MNLNIYTNNNQLFNTFSRRDLSSQPKCSTSACARDTVEIKNTLEKDSGIKKFGRG